MAFIPITLDKYVVLHLKNNPATKETDLRKSLQLALNAYNDGVKCSCGNDLWIIGFASVGNSASRALQEKALLTMITKSIPL